MDPGAADEEVLDARPGGRWLIIVLAAIVAAVVVRVVLAGHRTEAPVAAPIATTAPTGAAPRPPPAGAAVTSVDIITAAVGNTVYAVDAGVLITVDLTTGRRFVVHANPGNAMDGTYALLADPAHDRVWLIRAHDDAIEVSRFDTTTLARTGRQVDRGVLVAAAVLDGRLYLSTSRGVVAVTRTEEVPSPPRPGFAAPDVLTADPMRHRLLLAAFGAGHARLAAQRPAARSPDVRSDAPFGKGQLVVAGGRIWAAGFGAHGAVLQRLDPGTLRADRHSPLERTLGPAAVIVQAGQRHLLVRDGVGGDALWCVDAGSGEVTHYWPVVAGTPVLAGSGVFALVAGQPLERLNSVDCAG